MTNIKIKTHTIHSAMRWTELEAQVEKWIEEEKTHTQIECIISPSQFLRIVYHNRKFYLGYSTSKEVGANWAGKFIPNFSTLDTNVPTLANCSNAQEILGKYINEHSGWNGVKKIVMPFIHWIGDD